MRPISVLGAELAYVDFGHPAALGNFYGNTTGLRTQIDAYPKAFVLSGLASLPLRRIAGPFSAPCAEIVLAHAENRAHNLRIKCGD
jgi:hypothetical protein